VLFGAFHSTRTVVALDALADGLAGLPGASSLMPAAGDAGEAPTAFRARTVTEYVECSFRSGTVTDVAVVTTLR
jgi:hypothetical protein